MWISGYVCYLLAFSLLLHGYKFQIDTLLTGLTETVNFLFVFFAVFEPDHYLWAPRHWAWVPGGQGWAEYHQRVLLRGRPGVVPVRLRGLRPLHRIQSLLPETERQHQISWHFRRMLRSQTRGIFCLERYRDHGKNFSINLMVYLSFYERSQYIFQRLTCGLFYCFRLLYVPLPSPHSQSVASYLRTDYSCPSLSCWRRSPSVWRRTLISPKYLITPAWSVF